MTVDPSKLDPKELENLNRLQHFAAIGYVAERWAEFELAVDSWSIFVSGFAVRPATCLTAQIAGHSRKMDAFISLVSLYWPKHKFGADLDAFCKDAMGLAERRNRVVHDSWETDDILKPARIEVTARRKLRLERVEMKTSDVLDLAIAITELRGRFDKLADKITSISRPPSSPERPLSKRARGGRK